MHSRAFVPVFPPQGDYATLAPLSHPILPFKLTIKCNNINRLHSAGTSHLLLGAVKLTALHCHWLRPGPTCALLIFIGQLFCHGAGALQVFKCHWTKTCDQSMNAMDFVLVKMGLYGCCHWSRLPRGMKSRQPVGQLAAQARVCNAGQRSCGRPVSPGDPLRQEELSPSYSYLWRILCCIERRFFFAFSALEMQEVFTPD